MIKLVDILKEITEGYQFGVLYHYTEEWQLEKIIQSNILKGPISLTRSQDSFVKDFMGNVPIIVLDSANLGTSCLANPPFFAIIFICWKKSPIFFIADIAKRDKAEAARVAVIVENAIAEAARGSYTMGRRIID